MIPHRGLSGAGLCEHLLNKFRMSWSRTVTSSDMVGSLGEFISAILFLSVEPEWIWVEYSQTCFT